MGIVMYCTWSFLFICFFFLLHTLVYAAHSCVNWKNLIPKILALKEIPSVYIMMMTVISQYQHKAYVRRRKHLLLIVSMLLS